VDPVNIIDVVEVIYSDVKLYEKVQTRALTYKSIN